MGICLRDKRDIKALLKLIDDIEYEDYVRSMATLALEAHMGQRARHLPGCFTILGRLYCEEGSIAMFFDITYHELRSMPREILDAFRYLVEKKIEERKTCDF